MEQTYALNLVPKRDSVCDDKRRQHAAVERLDGVAGQDAVRDERQDRLGAVLLEHGSGLDQGAAGIRHVILDALADVVWRIQGRGPRTYQQG